MKTLNVVIKFDMEGAKDVTTEVLPKVSKSYRETVKRIMQNGKLYLVELADGYTAFCEKTRLARRIPEVGFIARIAKEEKEQNKTTNDYIQEFVANGIYFDGKTIPQFIDRIEDVEAVLERAEKTKTDKKTK